jgi:hypothetical protein
MRVRVIPVLIGLALVGAACTSNGGGQTAQSTQAVAATASSPQTATDKPTETKRNKDAKPYAETVKLAIDDIQDWWAKTMPEVYDKKYTAIPDAKIYAVTPKKPAPACTPAGGEAPYEQYEENAMYCTLGQFVAYDDQKLLPQLYKDYGEYALAMVFAHEWGHAIQDQNGLLDTNLPSFVIENQADCFAGAWTKHALDNKAGGFRARPTCSRPRRHAQVRDRPGTDAAASARLRFDRERVPDRVRGGAEVRDVQRRPAHAVLADLHQPGGPRQQGQPALRRRRALGHRGPERLLEEPGRRLRLRLQAGRQHRALRLRHRPAQVRLQAVHRGRSDQHHLLLRRRQLRRVGRRDGAGRR